MDDMPEAAPQPEKKKTKSDVIAHATVADYVLSHAKPNGGWKSFLHSNLFAALLLWCLSQAVIIGGFLVAFYMRTTVLSEWKGQVDATLKRMDDQDTVVSRYANQQQDKQLISHETRIKAMEDSTRHIEVIESEHRRLTKDVEDLRNGRR